MIIKLICSPFILLVKGIIALFPVLHFKTDSLVALLNLLMTGMNFFPNDVWFMIFGSIIFWLVIHILVGLYMFILDLIPIVR